MASESISCWAFYTGWEDYQRLLVGAVAPLTGAQLQRTIASELRSIGMLATHIVRTRDEVFHDGPDEVSRGWIIWHVIEHDLHHGGEFSYSLGTLGLAGLNLP